MISYLLWLWLAWRCSVLEMWSKVKIEKLQNDPSLASHYKKKSVLMKEFPNVSLVVMHSNIKINMDSNKRVHKQTNNKQTNMYGHLIEDANHLISQNVHHINHNKDINKWSDRGLICMDFHKINEVAGAWFAWIFMLIVTGIVDFIMFIDVNDMIKAQYRMDDPSACTTAPPGTISSCCWWADQQRTKDITPHKGTCSLSTLHDHWCSFCSFSIETLSPYFEILPFPR